MRARHRDTDLSELDNQGCRPVIATNAARSPKSIKLLIIHNYFSQFSTRLDAKSAAKRLFSKPKPSAKIYFDKLDKPDTSHLGHTENPAVSPERRPLQLLTFFKAVSPYRKQLISVCRIDNDPHVGWNGERA
jgi:hypothetical protein